MIEISNIYGTIYCLTNRINGKQYFGQTTKNIEKYFEYHRRRGIKGSNQYIHRAIRKYGWNNFKKEVICKCGDVLSLALMEDFCIVVFNTLTPNGYNLRRGGFKGKQSEKTKQQMSDNHADVSGKNNPMYGRTGVKHPMFGKKCPEQSKRVTGKNNPCYGRTGEKHPMFGKKRPEQSKRMTGENNPMFGNHRFKGENNPMYGRTGVKHPMFGKNQSEEARKIIAEKAQERAKIKEKCPYCKKEYSVCRIGTHKKACKNKKL